MIDKICNIILLIMLLLIFTLIGINMYITDKNMDRYIKQGVQNV